MNLNIYKNMLDTIGNTPLVNLSRFTSGFDGNILAKIEYLNPGLSKKDRVALQIIEDAENIGKLKKGQYVVELTSGNTGIGLAIICAYKKYPFIAVMSKGNSIERAKMIEAFGGKVILVDQEENSEVGKVTKRDLELAEEETIRIVEEYNAFRADQFNNLSNILANRITAEEIIRDSNGDIDVFVDFLGTGGGFMGIASKLKEYNKNIHCYVVEPQNAPYYSGVCSNDITHVIQGGGYYKELNLIDRNYIDDTVLVTDDEVVHAARKLAREEAILGGFSSGANAAAALKLLKEKEKGKTIVIVIPDTGLKYLSTNLYT